MPTAENEKKIYIRQPAYLPGVVFFDQMLQADTYVIYDNVQYERRHFGNRNKILTPQGEKWITVPVLQKGKRDQWYMDTLIDNTHAWGNAHWQAIFQNYRRAPYFSRYCGFFEDLYKKEWTRLIDLDMAIINFLNAELAVKTRVVLASELSTGTDFVNKTERLANIVKELRGSIYITCKGTKDYIEKEVLQNHGITMLWHHFEHPVYKQTGNGFAPNMSVIDLLFNCGEESGEIVRRNMQPPLTEYNPKPL